MKKIVSLIICSLLIIASVSQVSALSIPQSVAKKIDTTLETKVFAKFSKAKLTSIHTTLNKLDVEKITKNTTKQTIIQYLIVSFNEKYEAYNKTNADDNEVKITPNKNAILMLEEINKIRKKEGKPEFIFSNTLNKLALEHVKNMHDNNFYSHTLPDGTTFQQRIQSSGYAFAAGENIARGSNDVELILGAWMKSTNHRNNILKDEFITTGLANYNGYWVQIFGGGK